MGIRRFLKSLGGRRAGATRGGTPGSHVNTKLSKRQHNKALRVCDYAQADDPLIYDRTFFEDHHLDIPDELKERYK